MSKRILALVLALCMVFTLMPMSVMAQQGQTGFTDVEAKAFYAKAVAWAVENKVTNGMTKTTLSPKTDATRAQVATMLFAQPGSESKEMK